MAKKALEEKDTVENQKLAQKRLADANLRYKKGFFLVFIKQFSRVWKFFFFRDQTSNIAILALQRLRNERLEAVAEKNKLGEMKQINKEKEKV